MGGESEGGAYLRVGAADRPPSLNGSVLPLSYRGSALPRACDEVERDPAPELAGLGDLR